MPSFSFTTIQYAFTEIAVGEVRGPTKGSHSVDFVTSSSVLRGVGDANIPDANEKEGTRPSPTEICDQVDFPPRSNSSNAIHIAVFPHVENSRSVPTTR